LLPVESVFTGRAMRPVGGRSEGMKLLGRIGISLGAALVTCAFAATPFIEDLEFLISDRFMRLRGPVKPPRNIAVVAIDEASYDMLKVPFGPPWPRALHAQLLRKLKELGAKRVVFDVLFVGPGQDPRGDKELETALSQVPSVIGVEASVRYISGQGGGYTLDEITRPHEPFRKVTTEALVGLRADEGVIRQFPRPRSERERDFPTLSQAGAGINPEDTAAQPGDRDLIRYYGPGRTVPVFSYWDVLEKDLPSARSALKDAVVFVGIMLRSDTGGAQKDSYYSPFGGTMVYGVEVHATIVANLLSRDWITRPARSLELLCQGILVAGVSYLSFLLTPMLLSLLVGGTVLAWCVAAFVGLGTAGIFVSGAGTVLLILPLLVLLNAVYSYFRASKAEESLRSAFSLYISPDMVPQLVSEGDTLKLGGEKLWLSAMFTDIADFTTITEEMPAERTSEMLNAYFTEVMDVIFKNQGTLIKFIGDAVFAIWGAPLKVANHSELAVQTALAIHKEVERFNSTGRFPPLHTRIGVHTGPMLVGNLGSKRRFDYTAIGDSVNLASRIEGLNKYFGTTVLFSEATRKDAGGVSGALLIAKVRVKGRREAVPLFSVFEPALPSSLAEDWTRALQYFSGAEFDAARGVFTALLDREPRLRTACRLYLEQCELHTREAPPQGWAGELDFDVK
jgi:adenylate cyclase